MHLRNKHDIMSSVYTGLPHQAHNYWAHPQRIGYVDVGLPTHDSRSYVIVNEGFIDGICIPQITLDHLVSVMTLHHHLLYHPKTIRIWLSDHSCLYRYLISQSFCHQVDYSFSKRSFLIQYKTWAHTIYDFHNTHSITFLTGL